MTYYLIGTRTGEIGRLRGWRRPGILYAEYPGSPTRQWRSLVIQRWTRTCTNWLPEALRKLNIQFKYSCANKVCVEEVAVRSADKSSHQIKTRSPDRSYYRHITKEGQIHKHCWTNWFASLLNNAHRFVAVETEFTCRFKTAILSDVSAYRSIIHPCCYLIHHSIQRHTKKVREWQISLSR